MRQRSNAYLTGAPKTSPQQSVAKPCLAGASQDASEYEAVR